jgi:hypothetical protein
MTEKRHSVGKKGPFDPLMIPPRNKSNRQAIRPSPLPSYSSLGFRNQKLFYMKKSWLFLLLLSALLWSCEKDCVEKKKEDCACIALYDPVCGCNEVTYGNACEANCAGITDYTKGPCQ